MRQSTLNAVSDVVTIDDMAKKKTGGKHRTPRKPVQIPVTWIDVARRLAVKHRQPMMWFIVSLLATAAEKDGIELPHYPWDEDVDFGAKKRK